MEEGAERRARQLWLAPRGNTLEGREGERGGFRGSLWRRAEDIEGEEEGPTEEMRGGEKEEDQEKRRRGDDRNGGRGEAVTEPGAGEARGEWGRRGKPFGAWREKKGRKGERLFYYLYYSLSTLLYNFYMYMFCLFIFVVLILLH